MPPGADAVGFIHSERHQLSFGGMLLQNGTGGFTLKPLRREIQQPQRSIVELLERLSSLNRLDSAMNTGRCDASTSQLENLILHERHQW